MRFRRQQQSRVRGRFGDADQYDTDEENDFGNQEWSNDGRVTVNRIRPVRVRAGDSLRYEDGHVLERRHSISRTNNKAVRNEPGIVNAQSCDEKQRLVVSNQAPKKNV